MAIDGVVPSPDAWRKIVRAVERLERTAAYRAKPGKRQPPRPIIDRVEGILDGDLAAASAIGTASTATLSIWRYNGSTWADTGDNVTVTNRDPLFEKSSGDVLEVHRISNEWRPVGTPRITIGIAVQRITTGTYTVLSTDRVLLCDTDTVGGNIALTFDTGDVGQEVVVKNIGGLIVGGGNVTSNAVIYNDLVTGAGALNLGSGAHARVVWESGGGIPGPAVWWQIT